MKENMIKYLKANPYLINLTRITFNYFKKPLVSLNKVKFNDFELLSFIMNRRSIRIFHPSQKISKKDLRELITSGIWAPSGSNTQSQRFLVLTKKSDIEWLHKFRGGGGSLKTATSAILIFSDVSVCHYNRPDAVKSWESGERESYTINEKNIGSKIYNTRHPVWNQLRYQDCAASIQNILLLATAKGIASCWVSAFQNMEYSRLTNFKSWADLYKKFSISDSWEIMGMISLGYPVNAQGIGRMNTLLTKATHGIGHTKLQRKSVEECTIFV